MKEKLYHYKATVKKVKDGDTITVDIDLGFSISYNQDLRFQRINAFEVKLTAGTTKEMKAKGIEGKEFLKKLIEGKEIIIKTTLDKEKYGRILAEVYFEQDENDWICLNDELVKLGFAIFKSY